MSLPAGTGKRFHLGTHRIRLPEETWEGLRNVLPLAGITRVADVTALDVIGIPVFQAVRPAGRNLSVSQGKGLSPAAARVSAAMEALELWHAEDLSSLPQVTMSLREMRYANAVPLSSLRWASGLPAPDGMPLSWVRARSLTADREGWLPRAMLELDFGLPAGFACPLFSITSNGLASGNCREEALLHGLCELIERHALSLARAEPGRKVPLVEESIGCPWSRDLIARIRDAGFKVAVFDVTWEAEIPVLLADVAGPDLPNVWRGSGCHPSPAIALSRALTEAAQSRLTYISGARDDVTAFDSDPSWLQAFESFEEPRGERRFEEIADLSLPSVAADLEAVLERLAARGCEPFHVDYTRPEVGVAVEACFIPGLRDLSHG